MAKLYRHYKGNLYEYIGECMFCREQADHSYKCSCSGRIVTEISEACANIISKSGKL